MPETVACPVCGTGGFSPFLNLRDSPWFERNIVRCASCGLLYVNPQPSDAELARLYNSELRTSTRNIEWDRRAKAYRQIAVPEPEATGSINSSKISSPYSSRLAYRMRFLRRMSPPPSSVLDVGCGAGDFLAAASAAGYSCAGLDLSETNTEAAARISGAEVFTGEIGAFAPSWRDESKSFDAVTLWDVVEHLTRPADILKAANSIQPPGGVLALSTVNLSSYRYYLFGKNWIGFMEGAEHLAFFTPRTLSILLEKCGYRPVSVITRQIPAYLLKWLNVFRLGNSLEAFAVKEKNI